MFGCPQNPLWFGDEYSSQLSLVSFFNVASDLNSFNEDRTYLQKFLKFLWYVTEIASWFGSNHTIDKLKWLYSYAFR